MKLISMTEYTLKCEKERKEHWTFKEEYYNQCNTEFLSKVFNYANFLKQPLELWMFVPCDDDGNALEEPIIEKYKALGKFTELQAKTNYKWDLEQYQKAKERVLFEGVTIENNFVLDLRDGEYREHTVEKISKYFQLILTPTALKQIGIN